MALHLSGVVFRRKWKPPRLKPWEGPFADPTRRLPQAPDVSAGGGPSDGEGGRVSSATRPQTTRDEEIPVTHKLAT